MTCSGNVPNGFQAGGGVDNLTVDVLPGAVVSDGGGGTIIGVNDFNTVTNSGTLSAGPSTTGIFAGVNNTIVNAASGVITVGDNGVGIFAAGNSSVTNAGAITIGDAAGLVGAIVAINDDNTVSNLAGATITAGLNADGILVQGNRAIVNNAGTINASGAVNRRVRRRCVGHEQRGAQRYRQRGRNLRAGRPRPDYPFRHHQWRRRKRRHRL